MIKSMTAFARYEDKNDWGVLTWELRSVNHRYLEASIRMPEDLRGLEQNVRDIIAKRVSRGKLECNLRFKASPQKRTDINIDEELAFSVSQACERIARLSSISGSVNPMDVLRWQGVLQEAEQDLAPLQTLMLSALEKAIDSLLATREKEGQRILEMITRRCDSIDALVQAVKQRRPEVMAAIRDKLQTRVNELVEAPNQDRLEQELAMIAQKMDVDEELDRLETHIAEVRDVLAREESIGRRLDFLMQELNREANTLSSKSGDIETTQAAVELKVCIEQMREQIQNIE